MVCRACNWCRSPSCVPGVHFVGRDATPRACLTRVFRSSPGDGGVRTESRRERPQCAGPAEVRLRGKSSGEAGGGLLYIYIYIYILCVIFMLCIIYFSIHYIILYFMVSYYVILYSIGGARPAEVSLGGFAEPLSLARDLRRSRHNICRYVCVCIYIYICVCVRIYTYMHIYIST